MEKFFIWPSIGSKVNIVFIGRTITLKLSTIVRAVKPWLKCPFYLVALKSKKRERLNLRQGQGDRSYRRVIQSNPSNEGAERS